MTSKSNTDCRYTFAESWLSILEHDGYSQRVLNELQRTRLSRRRIVWLLPRPLPLSRQQVVFLSQSSCVSLG
jgi:hypothetical protein